MVVKVSRGATSTAGVIAHLRYIDRNGRLEIETDEGDHLKGKGIEKGLTNAGRRLRGPMGTWWALLKNPGSPLCTAACDYT